MQAAQDYEQQSLTAWAFQEFREMSTGFRDMLEPLLPRPAQSFNALDAEIAAFIAEWQPEQDRISEIVENISNPQEPDPLPQPVPTITETQIADSDGFFYSAPNGELQMTPVVTFNEKGQFAIDTSNGINLPDLTFDPRNGGEYSSEIPVIQIVLDQVQVLQDQVPAPIQSTGTDIYNTIIGYKDAEH